MRSKKRSKSKHQTKKNTHLINQCLKIVSELTEIIQKVDPKMDTPHLKNNWDKLIRSIDNINEDLNKYSSEEIFERIKNREIKIKKLIGEDYQSLLKELPKDPQKIKIFIKQNLHSIDDATFRRFFISQNIPLYCVFIEVEHEEFHLLTKESAVSYLTSGINVYEMLRWSILSLGGLVGLYIYNISKSTLDILTNYLNNHNYNNKTRNEIRRQYRKDTVKNHPDKNPHKDSERNFISLTIDKNFFINF